MRFITEFEFVPSVMQGIKERECRGEFEIGEMIGKSFGWKVMGALKSIPDELVLEKHKLEIEAFPMDKWVEFRKIFLAALPTYDSTSRIRLENALHDLESPSKPSSSAITNLSDQIGYRGSSSHCKACEDEAAGIKHIMAQKHTCKK